MSMLAFFAWSVYLSSKDYDHNLLRSKFPGFVVLVRMHFNPAVGTRKGVKQIQLGIFPSETLASALVPDLHLLPHNPQPGLPGRHLGLPVLVLALTPAVPRREVQLLRG